MQFNNDESSLNHARNSFMLGIDNQAIIFRSKHPDRMTDDSIDYNAVMYCEDFRVSSGNEFITVLTDVLHCNLLSLDDGDVVCIKVNGQIESYRFLKIGFVKTPDFTKKEQERLLAKLRKAEKFLNILDKRELSLSELFEKKYLAFAIHGESYRETMKKVYEEEVTNTYYSIYSMYDGSINKMNPFDIPFSTLENAVEFFMQRIYKKEKKNVILLNSIEELYRYKDYIQLNENLVMA